MTSDFLSPCGIEIGPTARHAMENRLGSSANPRPPLIPPVSARAVGQSVGNWSVLRWLLLGTPYGSTTALRPAPGAGNPFAVAITALFRASRSIDFWLLTLSFAICGLSTNG